MGISHPITGSQAVAVVKDIRVKDKPNYLQELRRYVLWYLGPEYEMGGVLFLSDLQMSDWPKNSSHKIVKKALIETIEKRRQDFNL